MRAIDIIGDAYERCNRLSPGEALSADDAAFGFRRLGLLVDEMNAQRLFLYRDILTSVAQTGNITLAAGSWAAVGVGAKIVSATVDGCLMSPITMQQYNGLPTPADTGIPTLYAHDGMSTVFLYPVATGQTIKLQTRVGVSAFADQTTVYSAPDGYAAALGAGLAVSIAPALLGAVPASLEQARRRCMAAITKCDPSIVDVDSFTRPIRAAGAILRGW